MGREPTLCARNPPARHNPCFCDKHWRPRHDAHNMKRSLLFDLDDTLMVEEPAAVAAFQATSRFAAAHHDVDAPTLALGVRSRARELWRAAPTYSYCLQVGISSWEGLWCQFHGEQPSTRSLRTWSPTYRREAWRLALADQDIEDVELAEALGERFATERRKRHEVFADAVSSMSVLRESHALALVTNGASCLQREKLDASGLSEHFDVVVVSADLGTAKPDPAIFQHTLSLLGCDADHRSWWATASSATWTALLAPASGEYGSIVPGARGRRIAVVWWKSRRSAICQQRSGT